MSQLGFKIADKFGKMVHKIIFVSPAQEEGKYIEICQRYFNPKDKEMKIGKNAFPIDPADWVRQSHNRLIQYKDWASCMNYGQYQTNELVQQRAKVENLGEINFYVKKAYVKPNGKILSSLELGVLKVTQLGQAVVAGAQMNVGLVIVLAIGMAFLMGGVLLGYFGFPVITGQHLVPNPTAVPK